MKSCGSNSSGGGGGGEMIKMERKTIEKQRRMQMKGLCLHLASLIPRSSTLSNINATTKTSSNKDESTQLDSLEEAAAYIVKLRNRIDQLKQMQDEKKKTKTKTNTTMIDRDATTNKQQQHTHTTKMPVIDVRCQSPNLEVVMVLSSSTSTCSLHKVIRIIEEEGADVVNGSQCRLGDKLVYTIHSQLRNPINPFQASALSNALKHCLYGDPSPQH